MIRFHAEKDLRRYTAPLQEKARDLNPGCFEEASVLLL